MSDEDFIGRFFRVVWIQNIIVLIFIHVFSFLGDG